MPTYIYQKKGDLATDLTDATGLVPSARSSMSTEEESWPFASALSAREKLLLDEYEADKGFEFDREEP